LTRLKNGKFVFIQIIVYPIGNPTSYLGATGTTLSYNLFAYCENDGILYVFTFMVGIGERNCKILVG